VSVLKRIWTQSILMRVGVALGVVTLIALAVILIATVFTEKSTGKASAINVAGSLRMQSYALATRVANLNEAPGDGVSAANSAIDGFEARLRSRMLVDAVPADPQAELRQAYERIVTDWQQGVKPLAQAAIADPTLRAVFLAGIDGFVAEVDDFVAVLERDVEARIQWLRLWLGVAFVMIFALVVTAIVLLQVEVFRPLSELLRSARAVRTGSFKARVNATGPDEMGQLGQAFNSMVEQLARLYGSLEKQVAEKTADLERKNRSLALLYETTKALSERPLDAATLQTLLVNLGRVLGTEGAMICAHRADSARGAPIAGDQALHAELCQRSRCAECFANGKMQSRTEMTDRGERRMISVPLVDGGVVYGVMPLALAPGRALEAWQIELAQTIGRHIGAALAAAERREEHQRLALLEERSAIARELHDSIAQSLSYTKIQLMRLSTLVESGADAAAAQAVLAELREGVASAYRQLREVLTTFRLKVGGSGFAEALREVAADFERRSGLSVAVHDEMVGIELPANAQIHLLQIVREALTNVEKHARAKAATIEVRRDDSGELALDIDDDGIGIVTEASPAQHFGLEIMRDRARLLGGRIDIGRRAGGGTRVALRFPARSAFASSPAPAVAPLASRETV
jgi:two-component system nitrate/nitrite sensor histidine kinase NarX